MSLSEHYTPLSYRLKAHFMETESERETGRQRTRELLKSDKTIKRLRKRRKMNGKKRTKKKMKCRKQRDKNGSETKVDK